MPSVGQEHVVLNNKQSLGLAELKTQLFDFLRDRLAGVVTAVWDNDCWFTSSPAITSPAADQISLEAGMRGTTGMEEFGNLVETGDEYAYDAQVPFENVAGVTYHVGLETSFVPTVLKTSKVNGDPQITGERLIVGNGGAPDSVSGSGPLTFVVDTVLRSPGRSCAGRVIDVWLVTPAGSSLSVALETLTVSWDGTNNKVTTTGIFGQAHASGVATDYYCVARGPTISATDLSTIDGILYVGTVFGTGPGAQPTAFHTEGATVSPTMSDLGDVIKHSSTGRLVIGVDEKPGEPGTEPYLHVSNGNLVTTFEVDRDGTLIVRDLVGLTMFTVGKHLEAYGSAFYNGAGERIIGAGFDGFRLLDGANQWTVYQWAEATNKITGYDGTGPGDSFHRSFEHTLVDGKADFLGVVANANADVAASAVGADGLSDSYAAAMSKQAFAGQLNNIGSIAGDHVRWSASFRLGAPLAAGHTATVRATLMSTNGAILCEAVFDDLDDHDAVVQMSGELYIASDADFSHTAHWVRHPTGTSVAATATGYAGAHEFGDVGAEGASIELSVQFNSTNGIENVYLDGASAYIDRPTALS